MYNVYTESPYSQDSTKCSLLLLNILFHWIYLVVVQSLNRVWLFATSWTAAHQASLSFTISWSLLGFMSIELVMLPNHFILCHPVLLLPSIFASIRVFSSESVLCMRWPEFKASVLPTNIQGWFPLGLAGFFLLGVQGTLKSLLQHYNSKASILLYSAFFMVQLTSVHNYWQSYSFHYVDLCRQSDVSAFEYTV